MMIGLNRFSSFLLILLFLAFNIVAFSQSNKDTSFTIISSRSKKEINLVYRYLPNSIFIQSIYLKGKNSNIFISMDSLILVEKNIFRKNNNRIENYLMIKSFLDDKSEYSSLNHDGIYYKEEVQPISLCSTKDGLTYKYKLNLVDEFVNLENDFTFIFDTTKMRIVAIE
jgi:hypothetical protein